MSSRSAEVPHSGLAAAKATANDQFLPPRPDPACFYGLVGDVAREGSDGNEASPIAIAGNFMAYLSCAIGRGPYLAVGNTSHHTRIFSLHIGRSGRGRKGDALSLVMRIDESLRGKRPDLAPQVHRGGLSSREGLAALIHDGYMFGKQQVPAIRDKRLWIVESEFANVLQQCRRGGNTLSAALRDCWDGVDLKPATKSNKVYATAPHIGLSGAITPAELLTLMQQRELQNGFANRFLMVWAERGEVHPFPKRSTQANVDALADRIIDILEFTGLPDETINDHKALTLSREARLRYAHIYREDLSGDCEDLLMESVLERRAPMLLRIAMLFALTDQQEEIEVQHINAALRWIEYATASARFTFSALKMAQTATQVELTAGKIVEFLAKNGSTTRKDLIVRCFQRHHPVALIDAGLSHLSKAEPSKIRMDVRPRTDGAPGRPTMVYTLT